jgi:HlyD family secretion protein
LVEAQSSGAGRIATLAVRQGMEVAAGALIATVVAADREQRLVGAQSLLTARRTNAARVQVSVERVRAQRLLASGLQREAQQARLRIARDRIGTATIQFDIQDGLFRRGLSTLARVNESRDAVNTARIDEAQALTALADIETKLAEEARGDADRVSQAETDLTAAGRSLAEIEAEMAMSSRITAPVPGRVIELKANLGSVVTTGQAIASIETGNPGLDLLAFVPSSSAREVQPGMAVRVSPVGSRKEEHGELLGTVTDISAFPVSVADLRALLQNETLAESISRQGNPHVARVALREAAPARYSWTTKRGEEVALSSGALATLDVSISRHQPIDLVVPALRKFFGL